MKKAKRPIIKPPPKFLWACEVSAFHGIYPEKPVMVKWNELETCWESVDSDIRFVVSPKDLKEEMDFTFQNVVFASESKEDVETFMKGARAALKAISHWKQYTDQILLSIEDKDE